MVLKNKQNNKYSKIEEEAAERLAQIFIIQIEAKKKSKKKSNSSI